MLTLAIVSPYELVAGYETASPLDDPVKVARVRMQRLNEERAAEAEKKRAEEAEEKRKVRPQNILPCKQQSLIHSSKLKFQMHLPHVAALIWDCAPWYAAAAGGAEERPAVQEERSGARL
eukprot:SAG11_NODE_16175_length_555_cov_0.940789_1_plen_119_part_10